MTLCELTYIQKFHPVKGRDKTYVLRCSASCSLVNQIFESVNSNWFIMVHDT